MYNVRGYYTFLFSVLQTTESSMIKDVFQIQKSRYSSMWGGDVISSVVRDSSQIDVIYALLAVEAKQLSPTSITLTISETGDFFVSNVRLLKNTSTDAVVSS